MGVIRDLYAKQIEERKIPLELSFGTIPMRVPGYVEIKEWDESTADKRQKIIETNMELYAAMVLKQWSNDPNINSASEEEIVGDIKETFTGDDVIAIIEWWTNLAGISRLSNFQKRR